MLGWILFVGLVCLIFGIAIGYFLAIWGLAHYIVKDIVKKETKEEKDGGL